jgi:hypothetical protein
MRRERIGPISHHSNVAHAADVLDFLEAASGHGDRGGTHVYRPLIWKRHDFQRASGGSRVAHSRTPNRLSARGRSSNHRHIQMAFQMTFMDGSPVDPEYAARVGMLIRDALDGEVSEQCEATVLAAYRQRFPVASPASTQAAAAATNNDYRRKQCRFQQIFQESHTTK